MNAVLKRQEDWQRRAAALSTLFSLDQQIPQEVLVHVALNPNYGVDLWISHGSDEFSRLIEELGTLPPLEGVDEGDLLAKVDDVLEDIEAVINMTVPAEILARRESICVACPNLKGSSRQLKDLFAALSRDAPAGHRLTDMICGACGCQLGRKLRWQTQNCPLPDPTDRSVSRWREPM